MSPWAARGRVFLRVVFALMAATYLTERLVYHSVVGAPGVVATVITTALLAGLGWLIYRGHGWLRWLVAASFVLNGLGTPVGMVVRISQVSRNDDQRSTAVSRIQRGVALELGNVSFLIPLMISLLLFPGCGRLVRPHEVAILNSLDKLQRLTCIEVAKLAIRSHRPQPTI